MRKRAIQVLATVTWLVPAFAAGLLALAFVPTAFGYESLIVGGGSMGGSMPAGSVALTRLVDTEAVGVGDVISYRQGDTPHPTTHRVIAVREKEGQRFFVTKGDANPRSDANPVFAGDQIHVVQRVVPLAGHLVALARSPAGGVLLFLVPMVGLTHQMRRDRRKQGEARTRETVTRYPMPIARVVPAAQGHRARSSLTLGPAIVVGLPESAPIARSVAVASPVRRLVTVAASTSPVFAPRNPAVPRMTTSSIATGAVSSKVGSVPVAAPAAGVQRTLGEAWAFGPVGRREARRRRR